MLSVIFFKLSLRLSNVILFCKNSLCDDNSPLKIAQTLYNKLYSKMDRERNKFPDELTDKDMSEDDFIEWSNSFSPSLCLCVVNFDDIFYSKNA